MQKQIDKHEKKIAKEKGRKDTTHGYWRGEIEDFEEQIEDRWNRLIKLKKKK